jgi:dipicolinate synthase subunit A
VIGLKRAYYFWVVGGDLRQVSLAGLLQQDGHTVQTYAMERRPEQASLTGSDTLAGLERADCVILPLPAAGEGELLHAPLSDRRIALPDLVAAMRPGQLLCGGKLPPSLVKLARARGILVADYFAREELAVKNAVPTAEGAIQIAMEELSTTLQDTRVLVIGFGRLGKMLAQRLRGLGAQVTVSARSYADLAWIEALGFQAERTDELEGWLCNYGLIINTVPALVLGEAALEDVSPDCLLLDLASRPGGIDREAAAALGLKVIWALSLPGKVAPATSGRIIRDTIYHILQEVET